jgi:hypothetical protein
MNTHRIVGVHKPLLDLDVYLGRELAKLLEHEDVDLATKRRPRLVQQLHDFLGYDERRLLPVGRLCREDDDGVDQASDILRQSRDGERGGLSQELLNLGDDVLELFDAGLRGESVRRRDSGFGGLGDIGREDVARRRPPLDIGQELLLVRAVGVISIDRSR